MGFDINGIRLLLNAKQLGVNFEKVITIGRQGMHLKESDFHKLLINSKLKPIKLEKHFESFFELLGAKTTNSLDASHYEGASIVHDMNLPLPAKYKGRYTLVVDGGSLEHIFNFPIAIKNCMELIENDGFYIGITPTNNFLGHGFYQFSPELYYRVFNETNGFKVLKMYIYIDQRNGKTSIFEVSDPNDVRSRVTLQNSHPTYLFVIAQKTEEKEIFKKTPQQSDYENIVWKRSSNEGTTPKVKSFPFLRRLFPVYIKNKVNQVVIGFKRFKLFFQSKEIPQNNFFRKTREKITSKS
jgi:hypothetical protein